MTVQQSDGCDHGVRWPTYLDDVLHLGTYEHERESDAGVQRYSVNTTYADERCRAAHKRRRRARYPTASRRTKTREAAVEKETAGRQRLTEYDGGQRNATRSPRS